jgi:hypothetical protein
MPGNGNQPQGLPRGRRSLPQAVRRRKRAKWLGPADRVRGSGTSAPSQAGDPAGVRPGSQEIMPGSEGLLRQRRKRICC